MDSTEATILITTILVGLILLYAIGTRSLTNRPHRSIIVPVKDDQAGWALQAKKGTYLAGQGCSCRVRQRTDAELLEATMKEFERASVVGEKPVRQDRFVLAVSPGCPIHQWT